MSFTNIHTLDLSLNNIQSSFISDITAYIKANCTLKVLYLDGNNIKQLKGVEINAILATLTDLSVDCDILPDLIVHCEIAVLCGAKLTLKQLIVCDHCSRQKAIFELSDLSYAKTLMISKDTTTGCSATAYDSLMPDRLHSLALVAHVKVTADMVSLSWITSDFFKRIGVMHWLSTIKCFEALICNQTGAQITGTDAEVITSIITNNNNLKTLNLAKCNTSPIRFYECPTAHVNYVQQCNASSDVVKQMLFALKCTKLIHLNLLNLSGYRIPVVAAETLAAALVEYSTLEVLLLKACHLQTESLQMIGSSLTMTRKLKKLDVSNNKLTDQSFETIASIINSNKNLKELFINCNNFQSHVSANVLWLAFRSAQLSEVSIDGDIMSESALCKLASYAASGSGIGHLLLIHPSLIDTGFLMLCRCSETTSLAIFKMHFFFVIIGKQNGTKTFEWKCTYEVIKSQMFALLYAFKKVTAVALYTDNGYSSRELNKIGTVLAKLFRLEDLRLSNLTSHALLELLVYIKHAKYLKTIEMHNCTLDHGVNAVFAKVLKNNDNIHSLVLQHTSLKNSGINTIITSLHTRTLTKLDLSCNYISDESVDCIANVIIHNQEYIESVYIGVNKLQANGMKKLLTSLKSITLLKHLSLGCNDITVNIAQYIADTIYKNPKLSVLGLHDAYLHTEGVVCIAKTLQTLSCLQYLDLSNNYIEKQASNFIAKAVFSNSSIQMLCISENNFKSSGIQTIAGAVAMISGLKELDLTNTSITSEAAESISNIIISNPLLESLLLGAGYRQVGTKKIEDLFIEEHILQQKWSTKITVGTISRDSTFNIRKSNKFVARIMNNGIRSQCNKLQTNGIIRICQALKDHKSLQKLSFENNDICDEAVNNIAEVLKKSIELKQLWIGSNFFSAKGISVLLKSLETSSKLEVLDLSKSKVSFDTIHDIAKVILVNKKIKQLWLETNKIQNDGIIAIFKSLEKCSYINLISLRGSITACCTQELLITALADIAFFVSTCVTLKHLYLGRNKLCDQGVQLISSGLKYSHSLHTLDLSNTDITEVSADSIAEVITSNSQLQQLFLGSNKLGSSGAIKIVTALQGSQNIQVLGLCHNHITSEAASEISTAVSTMPYLSTLMLDDNELEVYGVCTIIKGVHNLNWLTILSLTENVKSGKEEDMRMRFADCSKFKLYL